MSLHRDMTASREIFRKELTKFVGYRIDRLRTKEKIWSIRIEISKNRRKGTEHAKEPQEIIKRENTKEVLQGRTQDNNSTKNVNDIMEKIPWSLESPLHFPAEEVCERYRQMQNVSMESFSIRKELNIIYWPSGFYSNA